MKLAILTALFLVGQTLCMEESEAKAPVKRRRVSEPADVVTFLRDREQVGASSVSAKVEVIARKLFNKIDDLPAQCFTDVASSISAHVAVGEGEPFYCTSFPSAEYTDIIREVRSTLPMILHCPLADLEHFFRKKRPYPYRWEMYFSRRVAALLVQEAANDQTVPDRIKKIEFLFPSMGLMDTWRVIRELRDKKFPFGSAPRFSSQIADLSKNFPERLYEVHE